jgi:hypothetical protein
MSQLGRDSEQSLETPLDGLTEFGAAPDQSRKAWRLVVIEVASER